MEKTQKQNKELLTKETELYIQPIAGYGLTLKETVHNKWNIPWCHEPIDFGIADVKPIFSPFCTYLIL